MNTKIKFDKITIHCTDTQNGVDVPVEKIREWHLKRGFSDIGYHFVISPDGKIHTGRPISKTGSHVLNHNVRNVGICLIGRNKFTQAQFRSLKGLCYALQERFGIEQKNIFGHYEFDTAKEQGKSCPNFPMELFLAFYNGEHDALEDYTL